MKRHQGPEWSQVLARLEANADKLWSLREMESRCGELDVVRDDKKSGEYLFFDCSAETTKGRVSLCYDHKGLESPKENKPKNFGDGFDCGNGHQAFNGRTILRAAKAGIVRYEDIKLGEDSIWHP